MRADIRADIRAHQDGGRHLLCYIFWPPYHFTDGWHRGQCVTGLSIHLGTLYFHRRSFSRGRRSTTPRMACVGVCSGPPRV